MLENPQMTCQRVAPKPFSLHKDSRLAALDEAIFKTAKRAQKENLRASVRSRLQERTIELTLLKERALKGEIHFMALEGRNGKNPASMVSQYDSYVVEKHGKRVRVPLKSRYGGAQSFEIEMAIKATQKRIQRADSKKTAERLKERKKELEELKTLVDEKKIDFVGFEGRDKKSLKKGISQFDSFKVRENEKIVEYPLRSRIQRHAGHETDLVKGVVDHGSHTHTYWQDYTDLKTTLEKSGITLGEDEEGCPCCLAGLDFDEFAVALKEIVGKAGPEGGHGIWADFKSAGHWSLFSFLTAPLALIGLAAAVRNVKGTINTLKILQKMIKRLEKVMATTKDPAQKEKLQAFHKTLTYSRFDAIFNLSVPGIINGCASFFVLTTVIVELPLALPVIALYAGCQAIRNAYDLKRALLSPLKRKENDNDAMQAGKKKWNQVMRSKRRFSAANILGFTCFMTGATLLVASFPLLGLGVGPAVFLCGIAMCALGAASTGYMNNVWPAKFKPRNADLGVPRSELSREKTMEEIGVRRTQKKWLEPLRHEMTKKQKFQRAFLVFKSAMFETKDFVPESWFKKASKVLGKTPRVLPKTWDNGKKRLLGFMTTGSSVNPILHDFDRRRVDAQYAEKGVYAMQQLRNGCLSSMAGMESDKKDPLEKTWEYFGVLGIQGQFIEFYLQRQNKEACHSCADACESVPLRHAEGMEIGGHSHDHSHAEGMGIGGHSHDHSHAEGMGIGGHSHDHHHKNNKALEKKSPNWSTFHFHTYIREISEPQKQELNKEIDYFLTYTHYGRLRYQQYGLIDFYNQLTPRKTI